jgi:tetratricopeptide (TPR) repeat protein
LGIDYAEMGDYDKSTEYFLKSLSTYEAILEEKEDPAMRLNYALCLNNVGINYDLLGQHDKALKSYQESMKISKEIGDDELTADGLNNIGLIYDLKGEYEIALDYLKQALAIYEKLGYLRTIAIATANIGMIYSSLKDFEQSLTYHQRTLEIFEQIEDKGSEALATVNIASTYMDMNQPQSALPYVNRAIKMATELNAKTTLKLGYGVLAKYYAATNNFKDAYDIQKKLIKLKDSLYKSELTENIAEMQTKYETEKKEREIQILTQNSEIQDLKLKKQTTQMWLMAGGVLFLFVITFFIFSSYRLRQQNYRTALEKKNLETEQRMLRSQMNPHFIFNSMNSIQSYISGNDNFTAMTYLSKFAQLMRGILENSRQVMISLQDEINTLNLYVELEQLRFKSKFIFTLHIEPDLYPETTFIPPMLVQPFAENAIKHGLKNIDGNGLLQIAFSRKDSLIQCTIEDNGIGREMAGILNENKSKNHQSLGMQVTKERIDAFKKDKSTKSMLEIVDLKNEDGKALGTKVLVMFPFEEE